MAEEIDAQERLAAVHNLITDCETTAIEIDKQFNEFETVIGDSETKITDILANLDTTAGEIITHSDAFTSELTASMGNIVSKVGEFVTTMDEMLGTTEERSNVLFERLRELDGTHDEIQGQIDENASHMRDIFENLTTQWLSVTAEITGIQEVSSAEIDADVRQLLETHTEDQTSAQQEMMEQVISEYTDDITPNVNDHLSSVAEDFEQTFTTGIEALVETNREMQTEASETFSDMRNSSLDSMFGGAENLYNAVDGVMTAMKGTVSTTSGVADVVVDAMDQTNIGLNQLVEAIDNLLSLLGGLSLD